VLVGEGTPVAIPHEPPTEEQGCGVEGGGRAWGGGVLWRMDGALRTCHAAVKHTIARSAVSAGFRVEVEVHGGA
jgi:hypothetical protein